MRSSAVYSIALGVISCLAVGVRRGSPATRNQYLTTAIVTCYNAADYGHRHERDGEATDAEDTPGRAAAGDPAIPVCPRTPDGGRSDGPVRRAARSGADDGPDGDGASAGEGLPVADEARGRFPV